MYLIYFFIILKKLDFRTYKIIFLTLADTTINHIFIRLIDIGLIRRGKMLISPGLILAFFSV
jgi:hypothetical protein